MHEDTSEPASMLDSAFMPLTQYTHIAYAVNGEEKSLSLTKIGVASSNNAGDIKLNINPKYASREIILFKK